MITKQQYLDQPANSTLQKATQELLRGLDKTNRRNSLAIMRKLDKMLYTTAMKELTFNEVHSALVLADEIEKHEPNQLEDKE